MLVCVYRDAEEKQQDTADVVCVAEERYIGWKNGRLSMPAAHNTSSQEKILPNFERISERMVIMRLVLKLDISWYFSTGNLSQTPVFSHSYELQS